MKSTTHYSKAAKTILTLSVLVISACASNKEKEVKKPVVFEDKPAVVAKSFGGDFCTVGTNTRLGGMARMGNLDQHAIGHCAHPYWNRSEVIVLYFGDDGQQASQAYLDDELDSKLHPEKYFTSAEIAELDCTDGSACRANEDLLKKGVLVHFHTDSSAPYSEQEFVLLQRIAKLAKGKKIALVVAGHTDSTSTVKHNQPLSERRANAVKEILLSNGIEPSLITTYGTASKVPVASNATEEGRAQNRRAAVTVKGVE